jgi:hypothetical protein
MEVYVTGYYNGYFVPSSESVSDDHADVLSESESVSDTTDVGCLVATKFHSIAQAIEWLASSESDSDDFNYTIIDNGIIRCVGTYCA